jgi:hypothetical protein
MDDRIPIPNATRSIMFGVLAWPAACLMFIPVVGLFIGPFLSAILALAGLLAGLQALLLLYREPEEYKGMAQAVIGVVISTIGTLVFGGYALIIVLSLAFGSVAGIIEGIF